MSKTKGQNYMHGAAILTVGVIIMKILGFFYKIPLGNILGDEGYSMFMGAYSIYYIFFTLATAGLPVADYRRLRMMARNLYICYDQDETGLEHMRRLAKIYLDLKIIELPEDLGSFRARRGPCKDAKDLFTHYRPEGKKNPRQVWRDCMKLAYSLKFWMERRADGGFAGYEIDNEQLYRFLEAQGYARIESKNEKKGYTFCRVEGNIVELIDEGAIASAATATQAGL